MSNMKIISMFSAGDQQVRTDAQKAVDDARTAVEADMRSIAHRLQNEIVLLQQRVAALEGGVP